MDVDGVSLQVLPTIQSQTEPTVEETAQEPPQTSQATEPETTEQTESDSAEITGVIRNLLDGHFNGVADLRLRINHFEQLAIIASESLKAAAETEVVSLLGVVDSGIDNLPLSSELFSAEGASGDQTETETAAELHHEFDDTVNQISGDFQSAQIPSTDNLVADIKEAFYVFIEAMHDLLTPADEENITTMNQTQEQTIAETQIGGEYTDTGPLLTEVEAQITGAPEPAGNEKPPDDQPQTTEPDYQSILGEIEAAFAAAIAELKEALDAIQTLPELSEPSGNGEAYDKFLAVYNEMWGIAADRDNTASTGNVDMTA